MRTLKLKEKLKLWSELHKYSLTENTFNSKYDLSKNICSIEGHLSVDKKTFNVSLCLNPDQIKNYDNSNWEQVEKIYIKFQYDKKDLIYFINSKE